MDVNNAPKLPEQYQLLGKVSEGGMGSIFKAKNRYTNGIFAIKLLKPELVHDDEVQKRFVNEARAASLIKHPHICQVFDFGVVEGHSPYLVMAWIDGVSLGKKVKEEGPLSVDIAVTIFQQVAAALAVAHQNKVVHRDLKPDNIMLSADSSLRQINATIVDFGIAKVIAEDQDMLATQGLTQTGIVVGTPLYMSPEQARGKGVDARSDIYSLGCVLYYALTGCAPFVGESFVDTVNKHINELPVIDPRHKLPAAIKQVILRAMEKEPSDRYQSMDEIVADLKKISKGVPLEKVTHAGDRQKRRAQLVTIFWFVIGFIAMYFASVIIQRLLGAD